MSLEAMKMAISTLEGWANVDYWVWPETAKEQAKRNTVESITALRQAIEQAEKQEPVAWMVYTLDGTSVCVTDNPSDFTPEHHALPLYTAPPPRQPLTDEMLRQMQNHCSSSMGRTGRSRGRTGRSMGRSMGRSRGRSTGRSTGRSMACSTSITGEKTEGDDQ